MSAICPMAADGNKFIRIFCDIKDVYNSLLFHSKQQTNTNSSIMHHYHIAVHFKLQFSSYMTFQDLRFSGTS